jgi:hypothetical protein
MSCATLIRFYFLFFIVWPGRRRDDAGSKIAHETNNALTLSGHAREPSNMGTNSLIVLG